MLYPLFFCIIDLCFVLSIPNKYSWFVDTEYRMGINSSEKKKKLYRSNKKHFYRYNVAVHPKFSLSKLSHWSKWGEEGGGGVVCLFCYILKNPIKKKIRTVFLIKKKKYYIFLCGTDVNVMKWLWEHLEIQQVAALQYQARNICCKNGKETNTRKCSIAGECI